MILQLKLVFLAMGGERFELLVFCCFYLFHSLDLGFLWLHLVGEMVK